LDKINIHRVLIAPLDWGLGHATRCIPIIKAFRSLQYEVIIAAEGPTAKLLALEFPEIRIIHLGGYNIQYASSSKTLAWKILYQIPKIIRSIKREHLWLEQIIATEKIDLVISDNRYGLYTKKLPCVFITHQLNIKTPFKFLEAILRKINYRFIDRFAACWVPDAAGENNIAGALSHPNDLPKIPVHYIGILARMSKNDLARNQFDYCFLLSGPEPQRTILEEIILKSIPNISGNIVIIRGLPDSDKSLDLPVPIKVYNHLPTKELASIISASDIVVCRSGYTSVMELIGLHKKAILIPTPGQTEQAYLAKKLYADHRFIFADQNELDITKAFLSAKDFSFDTRNIPNFTINELEALLQRL
jgi:uncharacterized protein (TIGR00661 family)